MTQFYVRPSMRQLSARFIDLTKFAAQTNAPPVLQSRGREPFVRTITRTFATSSCNDETPATKPDTASQACAIAAVATPPLRANSTGYRVCLSHRCIAAAARAINRSQERPPRLKSGGTQVQLAARRRGRAHNLELARAPCGCKAAQHGPRNRNTDATPRR